MIKNSEGIIKNIGYKLLPIYAALFLLFLCPISSTNSISAKESSNLTSINSSKSWTWFKLKKNKQDSNNKYINKAINEKINTDLSLKCFAKRTKADLLYVKPDTLSFIFIGDIMLHKAQLDLITKNVGNFYCLDKIAPLLKKADYGVGNLEFALGGRPYTGYPSFSAPDNFPNYVQKSGIDIFLTANNHIMDRGIKGVKRSLSIYQKMEEDCQIRFTGMSTNEKENESHYPLVIRNKGISIALVNFTYGTNWQIPKKDWDKYPKINYLDKDDVQEAISRAKSKKADFIIALPHWGVEYQLNHSRKQRDFARFLASNDVDAIIGAHPHVVQDSCSIGKTIVFYSLGNAVSNMSAKNTQVELAVELRFAIDKWGNKKMLPPKPIYLWCSRPGGYCEKYMVLEIKNMIGKRNLWKNPYDYDKMINSYRRVKSRTGVLDNVN